MLWGAMDMLKSQDGSTQSTGKTPPLTLFALLVSPNPDAMGATNSCDLRLGIPRPAVHVKRDRNEV